MELTSKRKGNLTELQCMAAFVKEGCDISIPYGDNTKYDCIIDVDKRLLRIQIKTPYPMGESTIQFSCRTTHVNCSGITNEKYPAGSIDYFATYWNNQCYLVPAEECMRVKTLRFTPPKNSQKKSVNFADEYILTKQLQKIKEELG